MNELRHLTRPDGRLAYDDSGGDGALVVCVPGMAQVRQCYRLLRPLLVQDGLRVATLDLRGHGDSDADFPAYDDEALADDILALVGELGRPAVVVGNSMGAGAAVIAAARAPEQVAGLALLGPFVRNPPGALQKAMFRVLMTRPWGPAALMSFYPKWFPGTRQPGYEEDRELVAANLRRPGHWRAFAQTSRTSHAPAERALPDVVAPAVVVMGDADVDWKDPVAEARWIGQALGAEVVTVPGVGHYPQLQAPEITADAIRRLVDQVA